MVMNLYRKINSAKVQFDFVVSVQSRGQYDDEIESLGGRIFRLSHPSEGVRHYIKQFQQTLKQYGPFDVVHSHIHYFSGITVSLAKNAGVPIRISHSHNTEDGHENHLFRQLYRAVMKRQILKNSTNLFACSTEACAALFGKLPEEDRRIHLLKNAIDIDEFKQAKRINLRKALKLSEDAILVGHIGRFAHQKNHKGLIDIFASYRLENQNAHLLLVGEGELRDEIEKMVDDHRLRPFVHFLGVRKDIPSLLSSLDVLLFPSFYEGLSVVVVEAQAAGLPSVIADTISNEIVHIKELVTKVSLRSPMSEWISAIDQAIGSPSVPYEQRYKLLAAHGYDIHVSVKQVENLYGPYY